MVVPDDAGAGRSAANLARAAILMRERVRHVNLMKGLPAGQGITDYDPLQKDRRSRLEAMQTGDSQPPPDRLKAELSRELDVIELLLKQIAEVSAESEIAAGSDEAANGAPAALLARLKGIGPQNSFSALPGRVLSPLQQPP